MATDPLLTGYIPIEQIRETDDDYSSARIRDTPGGKARESIDIFPIELDFGSIKINLESYPLPLIILNDGYDWVKISGIKVVGDFKLSTAFAPASLAPDERIQVSIIAAPKRLGDLTGGIYFDIGPQGVGTRFVTLKTKGVA